MNINRLKKIYFFLITTLLILLCTTTQSLALHKNYFIKATVDYGSFGIMTEVIRDEGTEGKYLEEKLGYNYSLVKDYTEICTENAVTPITDKMPYLKIDFTAESKDSVYSNISTKYAPLQTGFGNNEPLVFSFPGAKSAEDRGYYEATSSDYTQAMKVSETLTTGLNQAIIFLKNNTADSIVSNHSLHLMLGRLSYVNRLSTVGSFEILVGAKEKASLFTLSQATENDAKDLIPVNGLDYEDYVKIVHNKTNTYSFFPYKMRKGYHQDGALYDNIPPKYRVYARDNENEYLSWGQLILQAMLNNEVEGTSEKDYASDIQTIIGQGLGSDLSRTISSVRSSLGLSSMSELVLNMGGRPANYHYGVMTKSMHNIALTIYTLNLVVALLFIGFMIVKMIHQKMLATTNIVAKTTLMEGIKDLIFVAILLGFFAPLFEMLLELNYLIVRTFSYSSSYMTAFNVICTKTLSMESMAGFIISTMFLSIDLYINFVYLVREIVVSFLFAIAPIVIVSYLWSPTQKNMVFGYMRELVGNIFMQSFHAVTMTFFAGFSVDNMTSLQALASAYCFIPITQFFKQLIVGNSGGLSEKIGGKLASQIGTTTMGMQKAGMAYKQSKEMLETQQKVNAMSSGMQVAGMVLGSMVPVLGPAVGAAVGSAVGGAVGNALGQKEIGEKQLEHSKEQLGSGLAELGMGMGFSSYDSAGDSMVRGGLSTIQESAKTRGQADARYNSDNLFGLGTATAYASLGGGIDGASKFLEKNVNKRIGNKPHYEKKVETDTIKGLDTLGLDANHIHTVSNINQVRGEVDVVSKLTMGDLQNNQKLKDIYNAFANSDNSKESKQALENIRKETGIINMYTTADNEFGFKLDSDISGFLGDMKTKYNPATNTSTNSFIIDESRIKTPLKMENVSSNDSNKSE